MKRYDSMGFESEHGIWVRAVDAEARIRHLEAECRSQERDIVTLQETYGRLLESKREIERRYDAVMQRHQILEGPKP